MRLQFKGRARRATAALGAVMLSVGSVGAVAQASGARKTARHVDRRRHPRQRSRPRPGLRALMLHPNVLVGQDVAFIGAARPRAGRRVVGVQQLRGRRWIDVARTTTDAHGHFLARYWPRRLGALHLRVRLSGVAGARATVVAPVAMVYRAVVASWYGPGGRTACGQELSSTTMGVANRTLPCGTLVTLHYANRTVRVPVIDRGPYVAGREYDLTYATKEALGASDVSLIWASA